MRLGPIVAFDPHAPGARAITGLFGETLIVCAVIGALVTGLVVYCVVKFRARDNDPEPVQVHGNRRLEITWAAIPLAIVIGLFALTARAMSDIDGPADRAPDIVITAHQWWWEVRYASGEVTANEVHIPVGKPVLVGIESADVIHDFWVPQLGRKLDAIPGHPGSIWLAADEPGTYLGACAEFCGAEHAWMRIEVIADAPAAFDAWQANQLVDDPPPSPGDPSAQRGAAIFRAKTCIACHAIGGAATEPRVAPSLRHIAARDTLGAGVLSNTPAQLKHWLEDPQGIKPGSHMPDFHLDDADLVDLVAFLETQR